MKRKMIAMMVASMMALAMVGCSKPAEVSEPAEQTVVAETVPEADAEAQRLADEKAEEERLAKEKEEAEKIEAEKKAEEERIAAEKAEEERLAKELEDKKAEVTGVIEGAEALIAEMTEKKYEDGIEALNALVDTYNALEEVTADDCDAFLSGYEAFLEGKEAFDAEYEAEQERLAAEAEAAKKAIPDWFDASYYAENNPDVVSQVGSSAEALYSHYTAHGKAEGRKANADDPAERKVAEGSGSGSTSGSGSGDTFPADLELYVIYGSGNDAYYYCYNDNGEHASLYKAALYQMPELDWVHGWESHNENTGWYKDGYEICKVCYYKAHPDDYWTNGIDNG